MAQSPDVIRVGQFSESPVLAVARALSLGDNYGIDWETSRVPSSPGQFDALRGGELDIVITSPDNVLLYTSTEKNPLGARLEVRLLRAIDRGLGLALYTSPELASADQLRGASLGVDVMSSGFALLLLNMLQRLGVDPSEVTFDARGATPLRLKAILDREIDGSILNAESAVGADAAGLKRWISSADIHPNYLGTVLATMAGPLSESTEAFVRMWGEATEAIASLSAGEVISLLSQAAPALAERPYVELLKSSEFGVLTDPNISVEQLSVLCDIRARAGAYTPAPADVERALSIRE